VGTIVRKLPDGRRLIVRTEQDSVVIDKDGEKFAVSASDLKALIALSKMSFHKIFCVSDWKENELAEGALAA